MSWLPDLESSAFAILIPVTMVVMIIYTGMQVVTGLRHGHIRGQLFQVIYRTENPFYFWGILIVDSLFCLIFGGAMICIVLEMIFRF